MSFFRSISRAISGAVRTVKAVTPVATTLFPTLAPTFSAITGSFNPIKQSLQTYSPALMAAATVALPGASRLLSPTLQSFGLTLGGDSTESMADPGVMQAASYQNPIQTQAPPLISMPLEPDYSTEEEEYSPEDLGLIYNFETGNYLDPETGEEYGYE